MKFKAFAHHKFFAPVLGAALIALGGLLLWLLPLGEPWVNASYDYLFRFGSGAVTNKVALIQMDNESYDALRQERGQPWDRALHAGLLNKLADDGCRLVVLDTYFGRERDPAVDQSLAGAMRRLTNVVLMAEQAEIAGQDVQGARPLPPAGPFLAAARTNWGVAYLDPNADLDEIVRRHWPFPSPGPYPSLPWTAARLAGARLADEPQERWIRYYGHEGAWRRLSYQFATNQAAGFFQDAIVFVGSKPKTTLPDGEIDEFKTPYTHWTGESSGGMEIQAALFLNLVNGDWLKRPARWLEAFVFIATGVLLGFAAGCSRLGPMSTCGIGLGVALVISLGAVTFSHLTNCWLPWLVIAGGQVPCALAYALAVSALARRLPDAPDYEIIEPPFGEGAYGKVWVARNAVGQWQALKAVYAAKFGINTDPYEREFRGISSYKPVSDKHPGLLRVDFVSTKKGTGYFYYVMELGDARVPGWEENPSTYKPRDLASLRAATAAGRLPSRECAEIIVALTEALEFLHQQGLTHRDIKPSNIIFVKGRPKLADVGLVVENTSPAKEVSQVGTPGYMPPPPEPLGTPRADIYALGMVLYVISTGSDPGFFPEISTTLVAQTHGPDFIRLNAVILKACQPDVAKRYASAGEMKAALLEVLQAPE